MDDVDRAIEHRLSGGKHYHHKGCIHNLPPADQIAMRGWTEEKWLAIIGSLPEQIAPDQWAT
jgi:hypothetical protein